jgi:hypothetical protein
MAQRTVSVEMQAKVGQYVAAVKEAEAATGKLDNRLDEIGQHDKDFAEMEKSAAGLAIAMKEPALAAGELADKVDVVGTQMKETAVDARFLADELKKARTAALEAAAAFAITGDKAQLLEFRKQTNYANQLARVGKALTADATNAGAQVGQAVTKGFESSVSGAAGIGQKLAGVLTNPVGLVLALGAAALVGAEVGGALGGAIVAGLGVGGVGAGVAAALGDPSVKRATEGLKDTLHEIAADVRNDFAGPTSDAVRILRDEFNHLRPSINATASELAPLTTELAAGAASGMDIFWEHLSKALINSKPLIEWTARELPKLADDTGSLLETMSEHADEAEFALDALFGMLKIGLGTLEVFTKVGAGVIDVLQGMEHAAAKVPGLGDIFGDVGKHGKFYKMAADEIAGSTEWMAKQQEYLTAALDANTAAFERSIRQMLDADNAAINYQQNIDDLTESVKQNGRSLDINTQAGRNNKRTLDQLVGSIEANYEENIKLGKGTHEANLTFLAQEGALQRQMKALGFSKQAIDDYIGRLDALRYAAISANNAINDTGLGHSHHDSYAEGGFRHAAAGMFIPPSDPGTTLVGEPQTGGEWLIPATGIGQSRAYDLISGAARGYGLDVGRRWRGGAGSAGGPSTLQLEATFVLPSGETVHKQLITYALNTGRTPSALFPTSSR